MGVLLTDDEPRPRSGFWYDLAAGLCGILLLLALLAIAGSSGG